MNLLLVKGKRVNVADSDDFAELLRTELGDDAETFFRQTLKESDERVFDESRCVGECDRTYQIQEHYERVLSDIREAAREIEGKKTDVESLKNLFEILRKGDCPPRMSSKAETLDEVNKAVKLLRPICNCCYHMIYDRLYPGEKAMPTGIDINKFAYAIKVLEGLL